MIELTHKRKWDSKLFDTGRIDKKERPIYGTKLQNGLHDIDPDGSFVECVNRFRPYVGNVSTDEVVRGRGKVRISDTASESKDRVKITTKRDCGVSLKLKGHRTYGPNFDTLKDCYYDTYDGVTLRYYPNYKGVNIVIEVTNPQTASNVFRFTIKEYGCSYTYEKIEGGIKCISSTGEDDVFIKALYAIDANGESGSVDIFPDGVDVDGYQIAKKVIAPTWFGNAVGPVRIDPSITIEDGVAGGVIEDADMNGGSSSTNYGASTFLFHQNSVVGFDWLIKTVVSGLGIGTITLVKYIFLCDSVGGGGGYASQFRQLLRDWNEGTKSGSGASTGEVTAASARHNEELWTTLGAKGAGTDYNNVAITASFNAPVSTGSFDVVMDNAIWQSRVDGGTNYGDVLHAVTDSGGKSFQVKSSEGTTPPQLYIEWVEDGGGFPFFFDAGHY